MREHGAFFLYLASTNKPSEASESEWWPLPTPGLDGAYPDCSCLGTVSLEKRQRVFAEANVSLQKPDLVSERMQVEYPPAWGSRCSDWDLDFHPQCLEKSLPQFCLSKWCYVNRSFCKRRNVESEIFRAVSYSYETCGFLDHYLSPSSWAVNILYAFAFGLRAGDRSGLTWLDMFLQFADRMLRHADVRSKQIRYRQRLSNATKSQVTSTYTGCIYDIGLGHVDMCLGDFWDTPERRSLGVAAFKEVAREPLYLMGYEVEQDLDFWETLRKPFDPFHWSLWLMILSVVAATSIGMLVLEFHRDDGDFSKNSLAKNWFKSVYFTSMSIVDASVCYTAVTLSGRILALGYGFFVLICIASFTAETAAFLLEEKIGAAPTSLEDVIQKQKSVCYSAGMKDIIEAYYPGVRSLSVLLEVTSGEVFAMAMATGKCQYSIVGELWMQTSWEKGEHCELNLLGNPLVTFPTGFWVKKELDAYIGLIIAEALSAGIWADVRQSTVFPSCKSEADGSAPSGRRLATAKHSGGVGMGSGYPTRVMDAKNMLGAAAIPALCFLFASIIRVIEISWRGLDKQDKEEVEIAQKVAIGHVGALTEDEPVEQELSRMRSMKLEDIKAIASALQLQSVPAETQLQILQLQKDLEASQRAASDLQQELRKRECDASELQESLETARRSLAKDNAASACTEGQREACSSTISSTDVYDIKVRGRFIV